MHLLSLTIVFEMIPEYEKRTALRIPTKQREQIEKLVSQGKFRNLSEVVRAALDEFLKNA
jgi:Arc/MetJ-type ribon-helix-helix transcriptional regulator